MKYLFVLVCRKLREAVHERVGDGVPGGVPC